MYLNRGTGENGKMTGGLTLTWDVFKSKINIEFLKDNED